MKKLIAAVIVSTLTISALASEHNQSALNRGKGKPDLVYSPPQIVLLAIDLHEDLVNVESIPITSVLSFQSACINGTKLDAPEAYRC